MKKKARRTIILLSAVVSGIFVLALLATVVVFAVWSNGDTIIQNMSYRDINLSRMTTEQANQSIKESITPSEKRVKFLLGDKSISMSPSEISFSYDPTLIAETAFARARNKTFFKNYAVWTQSWFTKSIIADAQVESYNILSLETIFDVWDSEILGEPTTGDIKINKTEISFTPPRPGSKIDRPTAAKYIVASFVEEPDKALIIPTVSIPITVNVESISNVYEHLVALTDEPIILKAGDLYPDSNVTLSPKDLRRILYLERDEETFEYTTLINLERLQGYFKEITVRDAEFDTKDMFNVKIIPSQDGLLIDYDLTALAILEHDTSTGREINFINDGKHDALFNTKDAEGLGIKHLISEFTTYHPCCQTRVENIQLFADLLDGTIIKPNNRFNLNTAIGERTEDLGFSPAGTIIAGELVDTVGGGISQFATTFYNTVFWAGFPNIIHKPHSFYFPRYPEGIEATISWPYPALVFRNDNDTSILIRTKHTPSSITVQIFGDNDGRVFVGSHKSGESPWLRILRPGGIDARDVTASVSGRYNDRTAPTKIKEITDPEIECGETKTTQLANDGWSVDVVRIITQQDRDPITEQNTVVYSPSQKYVHVGACDEPLI